MLLVTVTLIDFVVPAVASTDSSKENMQVNNGQIFSDNGSLDDMMSQVDQKKTTAGGQSGITYGLVSGGHDYLAKLTVDQRKQLQKVVNHQIENDSKMDPNQFELVMNYAVGVVRDQITTDDIASTRKK